MLLLWKTVRQLLGKLNVELQYDPLILLLYVYIKKRKAGIWTDIFIPVFTAALLTIVKRRKQPKCLSANEWISKMCFYIYIFRIKRYILYINKYVNKYISKHTHTPRTLRRNEILTHATTWINLEDMMLSEIGQTQREKYFMIPYLRHPE